MNEVFYHSCETMAEIPDRSVHTVVTSPPYYGLRDYGVDGQIGLEPSIAEYIDRMVAVFREVRRVLRDDGTIWVNLGDSYASGGNGARDPERWPKQSRNAGSNMRAVHAKKNAGDSIKPKDLIGMPWRVAFALQEDGWYLRSDIVWSKPNPMPESIQDRPTRSHEYIFLLSKQPRYYYDIDAIREPLSETSLARLALPSASSPLNPDDYKDVPRADRAQRALRNLRAKTVDNPHLNGRRQCPEPGEPGAFHPSVLALIPVDDSPNMFDAKPNGGKSYHDHKDDLGQDQRIPSNCKDYTPPGGRNRRTVWEIATYAYSEAHFATFPPDLIAPCILAGCPPDGVVLDPFMGSGTTAEVAESLGRRWLGYEINEAYRPLIEARTRQQGLFAQEPAS